MQRTGYAEVCMSQVTRILSDIEQGNQLASEQLLPLIYQELRQLAAAQLAQEKPGHTLQATALVHEAYLRLVDVKQAQNWNSRGHFFIAAAEAMRRILIENARQKKSLKRGGQFHQVELDNKQLFSSQHHLDLLDLNEALDELTARHPRQAEVVKLRYFAGLTIAETASALGIAESTADADWAFAKSWLYVRLQECDTVLT